MYNIEWLDFFHLRIRSNYILGVGFVGIETLFSKLVRGWVWFLVIQSRNYFYSLIDEKDKENRDVNMKNKNNRQWGHVIGILVQDFSLLNNEIIPRRKINT